MSSFTDNVAIMKNVFLLIFISLSFSAFSQCEILHRVSPDGSMQYYIQPVNFYYTNAKSLKGGIVTDKENYFLELEPIPFPAKPAGKKLKKDLEIKLSDGKNYQLSHYDTRYVENDTVMTMLYLINKKDMALLQNNEVTEARIDMGSEGIRTYIFKLHKAALKDK